MSPRSALPSRCVCGGVQWDDLSDGATGTAYARCRQCGMHWAVSRHAWRDMAQGLLLQESWIAGSAWTKSVQSTFLHMKGHYR